MAPGASALRRSALAVRALLALALLIAPFGTGHALPASAMPICAAEGGTRLLPDPLAPAFPLHAHCDACLVAPPALPAPLVVLCAPPPMGQARLAETLHRPAPPSLPPEQARGPPLA
jgi:hypothetical protein